MPRVFESVLDILARVCASDSKRSETSIAEVQGSVGLIGEVKGGLIGQDAGGLIGQAEEGLTGQAEVHGQH